MDNYTWFLNNDLSKFAGEWVVIVDNKVVENGNNIKKILEKAKKKYPKKERVLTKVPKKETLIL